MTECETKTCQNCKSDFIIESEDFEFYERMKVPAPTWCAECRFIRRFSWRNERSFYKRRCDAPGHDEEVISVFSPEKPMTVYDQKYWWSDKWDPMEYAREYDSSRSFFEQFNEHMHSVPLMGLAISKLVTEQSPFTNHCDFSKNSYCF